MVQLLFQLWVTILSQVVAGFVVVDVLDPLPHLPIVAVLKATLIFLLYAVLATLIPLFRLPLAAQYNSPSPALNVAFLSLSRHCTYMVIQGFLLG